MLYVIDNPAFGVWNEENGPFVKHEHTTHLGVVHTDGYWCPVCKKMDGVYNWIDSDTTRCFRCSNKVNKTILN